MKRVDLYCRACNQPIGRDLVFDPQRYPWHDRCFRERYDPEGPLRAPTSIERVLWQLPLAVRIVLAVSIATLAVAFAVGLLAGISSASAATGPTYLGCGDGINTDFVQHPRFCDTLQPGQVLAQSIALDNLHWHSWGGLSATATARTKTKTYDPWEPVRVRVYRRIWSDCIDGYAYTRLRVTLRGKHYIWKMLDCA